jgi:DTW domain-containing protein YfiP
VIQNKQVLAVLLDGSWQRAKALDSNLKYDSIVHVRVEGSKA